ncbi:MAG: C39 family peptidase [Candidatus Aenigmatarchaeota archaeon]|nr:MAG: C39 family peptidase [Candidatus Aenigmarchaeota archaeon]
MEERVKRANLDVPFVKQSRDATCVYASTAMVLQYYGLDVSEAALLDIAPVDFDRGGMTTGDFLRMFNRFEGKEKAGLRATVYSRMTPADAKRMQGDFHTAVPMLPNVMETNGRVGLSLERFIDSGIPPLVTVENPEYRGRHTAVLTGYLRHESAFVPVVNDPGKRRPHMADSTLLHNLGWQNMKRVIVIEKTKSNIRGRGTQ